jgi:hypothetical protein
MKIKTLGWLLAVTALASSASVVACSQAPVQCQAAHSGLGLGFAAKYYPVGTPGAACAIKGDEIGFETYHPPGGGEDGKQPDFSIPSRVAVKTTAMGNLIASKAKKGSKDPDGLNLENADGTHVLAKNPAYSLGTFATVEPVEDFCAVADPKPAVQSFPRVEAVPPDPMDPEDMGSPEEAALAVKYEWTDLKVYVTAAAQGTQFSGRLKYTENACSAEYNVAGVWPPVHCGVEKEVDDGMGGTMTIEVPEASLCCPTADPLGGRVTGSGINPDFPVKCDPDLLLCVLDTPDPTKLPILSPGWDAKQDACKVTEAPAATP